LTTAEAIEGMTDAGKFEILALRALRILDADCPAVIHLGVNAQGKTIPNPIDGFCQVPGSDPPKYVLPAFTLLSKKGLRRKWLLAPKTATGKVSSKKKKAAKKTDDGDLVKAAGFALKLRDANPKAHFVVYLCTNRVPSSKLIKDAHLKAKALGVEARFLDQSRLRDFLDFDPHGQWLRQEHLGIEADQLSLPLLQQLSGVTLQRYAAEMLFSTPSIIVETAATRDLREAIRQPTIHMHGLIGPSGVGKTVIAFEVLRQHIAAEGVGFWISRETAERATTLGEAIDQVLRAAHPALQKGAGQAAFGFGTVERPVILVIDDINRSPSASNLIQKVIGWARLAHGTNQSGKAEPSTVRLLCPIWDSNYRLNRELLEPTDWLRAQSVGPLLRNESVECLRLALGDLAGRFSDLELADFAEVLRDDAILLRLFAESLKKQIEASPLALAQDVIGNWVDHAVGDVAEKSGCAVAQYKFALRQLSSEMIRKKKLYPKWAELEGWFNSRQQIPALIGQLAAKGAICRISDEGGSNEFQFRHDRILEYHLRESLSEMLAQDPPDDSVWDPFFVPYMGWALAIGKVASKLLDLVVEKNPVALIAAVEHLPTVRSEGTDGILAKAWNWLGSASGALPSIRDDAYDLLANIESPYLLALTEGLGNDRRLLFGRLRNGEAPSGALALSERFFPAVRHQWLETLIHRAKSRHHVRLVSGLGEILRRRDLADPVRSGALSLAGYLGDDSLASAVKEAWNNAPDRNRFLVETLWAGLRCCNVDPEEVLNPLFTAILELKDDGKVGFLSDRQNLLQELQFTARHGFSDTVVTFLTKLGRSEEYERIVVAILDRVTRPAAVDFVVRSMALVRHCAEERGGFFPWKPSWADRLRSAEGERTALPAASKEALRTLWQDEGNPDWLRKYALEVWANVGWELSYVQSIPETSPLHDAAVRYRAERGDLTVVAQVVREIDGKTWWLQLLPQIWCRETAAVLDCHLTLAESDKDTESNGGYLLAQALRDIPVLDAERLLLKHWPGLRRNPRFIQAALYLSTVDSRSRAYESIRELGADAKVFQVISMYFGFMTTGLCDRLSIRHLESLRPYISRLDGMCIGDIVEFCRRHGYWDWAIEVLRPECSRRAKAAQTRERNKFDADPHLSRRHFPTDENLLEGLESLEKNEYQPVTGHVWFWFEQFSERGDSPDRAFQLAERWLQSVPSLERFTIVATLIKLVGTRQHLSILETCVPVCNTREAAPIIADVSYAVRRRSLV
jgi:hypothetical protein